MFTETVSSRDAATEPAGMHSRRILVNMSFSCTASDRPLVVLRLRAFALVVADANATP
jgi:hypothetical protein